MQFLWLAYGFTKATEGRPTLAEGSLVRFSRAAERKKRSYGGRGERWPFEEVSFSNLGVFQKGGTARSFRSKRKGAAEAAPFRFSL